MGNRRSRPRLTEPELRARIDASLAAVDDYIELAEVLKRASRFQEAADIYERGLQAAHLTKLERASLACELGAVTEMASLGPRSRSAALAEQALAYLPDEPESCDVVLIRGLSYSVLAHAVWFSDRAAGEEAAHAGIRWLEQAVRDCRADVENTAAYYELARLHNALKEPLVAAEYCERYLRSDLDKPSRLAALTVLAEAQESAGQLDDAERTVHEALRWAGDDNRARPLLYQTLGLIALAREQWPKARDAFDEALHALLSIEPRDPDPEMVRHLYWALVQVHFKMGNRRDAIAALKQLLIYYDDDVSGRRRAYLWLGDCHADLSMRSEARRYYDEVLKSPRASDEERAAARDGLAALGA